MRRHPKDSSVPHISDRGLRDIASQLARIDSLHRMSPTCWVALVECSHDEMLGRKLLIPVSCWMCVPNVAVRYVVKLVGAPERLASPKRVRLSFRYDPEFPRICQFDLTSPFLPSVHDAFANRGEDRPASVSPDISLPLGKEHPMSAENELAVFPMENGQLWIVSRACGDTIVEAQGECAVLARCDTYEETEAAFVEMMDEGSDSYVYAEHGYRLPTREELKRQRPHLLGGTVTVQFDRPCGCVDFRDLQKKRWSVVESRGMFDLSPRVLGERLWYAQAVTMAHAHAVAEPGTCSVSAPTHFRVFRHYNLHECDEDHWSLCLPRGA